ncbi:MAG: Ig-like domain-containing protein, partial [Planctomycetota bacterium]
MRRTLALLASLSFSLTLAAQSVQPVGTGGTLGLVQTIPAANAAAPANTTITLVFDEPVSLSSLDARSFHVFGRNSGAVSGQLLPLNGGKRVLFVPAHAFAAGEVVTVQLTRGVRALDGSRLRAAGHAFQFGIAAQPSGGTFTQYAQFSNRIAGAQTRIYGANAIDLDGDLATDLATVNEV